MIFLDTSAIYAMADLVDPRHEPAKERFQTLLDAGESILTHNYVLVEFHGFDSKALHPSMSWSRRCGSSARKNTEIVTRIGRVMKIWRA